MAVHFIDTSKISDSCRDSIKRHISYVNKIPVNMTKNERFVLARVIGMGYRDWETDRKSTRLNSSHRL